MMSEQTYIPRGEFLGQAPEQSVNEGAEMSKLETALRNFNDYFEQVTDVRFGAAIGRLAGTPEGNALNMEYGRELQKAQNMKRRIETALGAWESVKSMVGLGALPLIPIAVALGLTAALAAAVSTGRSFLRTANIRIAMQADPDLSFDDAAKQVAAADRSSFDRTIDMAQIGLALLALWGVYKFIED